MIMKVFPHGTGEGDKPTRYLVSVRIIRGETHAPRRCCEAMSL